MLDQITYFQIFGKPLIMYLGIITWIAIVTTALISILNKKGITKIPFKWHPILAIISITLATIHGILGLLIYF